MCILDVVRFIVGFILRNKLLVLFSILVALNLSWIFEQTASNSFSKVLVQHWSQIQNMALCELLWRWLLPAQAHPVQLTDIKRYWASVCYGNPWVLEWIKKETLIYLLTLIKCEPNYHIFLISHVHNTKLGPGTVLYRLWGMQSGWGWNP